MALSMGFLIIAGVLFVLLIVVLIILFFNQDR